MPSNKNDNSQEPQKVVPNNKDQESPNALPRYIQQRGIVFICIVIDCFFLAIWAAAIHFTQYIMSAEKMDNTLLGIFIWVSGAATLIQILVYTLKDLIIFFLDIREEIESNVKRKK